jgi:hypothetical protein
LRSDYNLQEAIMGRSEQMHAVGATKLSASIYENASTSSTCFAWWWKVNSVRFSVKNKEQTFSCVCEFAESPFSSSKQHDRVGRVLHNAAAMNLHKVLDALVPILLNFRRRTLRIFTGCKIFSFSRIKSCVMNQAQRAFVIHVTTEKNTILYCIFFW